VREQALSPRGELLQDFHFVRQAGALHVLNAPSPEATASFTIADKGDQSGAGLHSLVTVKSPFTIAENLLFVHALKLQRLRHSPFGA